MKYFHFIYTKVTCITTFLIHVFIYIFIDYYLHGVFAKKTVIFKTKLCILSAPKKKVKSKSWASVSQGPHSIEPGR